MTASYFPALLVFRPFNKTDEKYIALPATLPSGLKKAYGQTLAN